MATILRPVPDLRERVWGGRRLGPPRGAPIGEAWVAGPSNVVADGPDEGRTLADIAARDGATFVGRNAGARTGDRFPLLVKLLDPAAWLSVQVHPDDETALRLEGPEAIGKAEAWFVLDAIPGAEVLAGVRAGVPESAVRTAIAAGSGSLPPLLIRHRARAGDIIPIPAGTLHAVGPGVFLYEVQQPSDVTYRCDDWGRLATPERPLHVAQALASVRPASRSRVRHAPTVDRATVVEFEEFILEQVVVGPDRAATLNPGGASVHVVTALDGPIRLVASPPDTSDRVHVDPEPMVLGGLETAVVSAAVVAYTIDAPSRARVLVARVP